jgi:hypothetical protein
LPLLAALLLLSACGGSGINASASAQSPQRGQLIDHPPVKVASYSTSDLLSKLGTNDVGKELLSLAYSPVCSIDVYQLRYQTVGAQGEATTASGALMIPTGLDPTCRGSRPIVLYARGTSALRTYNIADLSNADNKEGLLLGAVFAARGYIVVAPNYAGYDSSTLPYHPFLNADQQSKDMMDALTATHAALPTLPALSATASPKLFVTGYSQGGYVAMATHRALQAAGTAVTASAPMSGPYTLAAFGDAMFMGEVTMGAIVNVTMLITGYQHAYGNIYTNTTDVFEARYAQGIDSLLPSNTTLNDLYTQGRLPKNQLFNSTPPAPEFAPLTPATTPANLAPVFAMGFGPNNLITNTFRLAYLRDAQAAPDGGFPTTTTGLPPQAPVNPFRRALKLNDLRNWAPAAPVLLCAGNSDPTVLYLNTQLMQGYWAANAAGASVTVLDVDSPSSTGDPYSSLKTGFAAAKGVVKAAAVVGGASDGGAQAVLEAYHAGLVPPFCLSAAKSFFDAH